MNPRKRSLALWLVLSLVSILVTSCGFFSKGMFSVQMTNNRQANNNPTPTPSPSPTPTPAPTGLTITSFTPVSGPVAGGTPITITGTDFITNATVTVAGGACADIVVVSSTEIKCTTAANTAPAGFVVVQNTDGDSFTSSSTFTFTPNPTFTNVNLILQSNCISCHNATLTEDGVNYTSYATTLSTGSVFANDPDQSAMYMEVEEGAMPPGNPLNAAQIQLIHDWIQAGALNN
jgi:hypothetical protein